MNIQILKNYYFIDGGGSLWSVFIVIPAAACNYVCIWNNPGKKWCKKIHLCFFLLSCLHYGFKAITNNNKKREINAQRKWFRNIFSWLITKLGQTSIIITITMKKMKKKRWWWWWWVKSISLILMYGSTSYTHYHQLIYSFI